MTFSISRYFQIFVGVLSGPGIVFILPFIIPKGEYAKFIGFTVVVQLISILGSAGIEVIGARNLVRPLKIIQTLIFTHSIVFLGTFTFVDESFLTCLLAMLCAFSANLSVTLLNYVLFLGQTKRYAYISFIRAGILVVGTVWVIILNGNLMFSWVMLNVIVSMFCVWAVAREVKKCQKTYADSDIANLLGNGLTMFLINVGATLPFIFDRVIAKNHLSPDMFAQFMVATTWSLPIVYLGNATQQLIVSSGEKIAFREIATGIFQLFSKSFMYILLVLCISIAYTPPYFSNSLQFVFMWLYIFAWQAVYSCLMFPMAALIQRGLPFAALRPIRNLTLIAVGLALITYFLTVNLIDVTITFSQIVACSSIFAFTILLCRVYPLKAWIMEERNCD